MSIIKRIVHKIRNILATKNKDASQDLSDRLNELAYFTNLIKNGMTAYLGDHMALTRIFTGQKMYVDTRDVSLVPHLMLEGYWEMHITEVIRRYIKPDSIFFDIGAHVGYYSLIAGTHINTGKIHAFEANPEFCPLIKMSAAVNGLDHIVSVNNVAVSDKKGVLKLSRFENLWGSATVHEINDTRIDKTYAVEAITLDDYAKANHFDHVDVAIMDIEGFEDRAYIGMKNLVANSPNLIMFMEFTRGAYNDAKQFYNKLMADFAYIYSLEDNSELHRLRDYTDIENRTSTDWVMLVLSHRELS